MKVVFYLKYISPNDNGINEYLNFIINLVIIYIGLKIVGLSMACIASCPSASPFSSSSYELVSMPETKRSCILITSSSRKGIRKKPIMDVETNNENY